MSYCPTWAERSGVMKSLLSCCVLLLVACVALPVVPAYAEDDAVIYATGFENPPFTAGLPLVGQDGWVGVPRLSPNAAVISTDLPFTGSQSVRVAGADLAHQDSINKVTKGYYDAIGSYRK